MTPEEALEELWAFKLVPNFKLVVLAYMHQVAATAKHDALTEVTEAMLGMTKNMEYSDSWEKGYIDGVLAVKEILRTLADETKP